jgi:hypothetical protein
MEVNEQAAVFVSDTKGTDFTRRLHPYNLFFWTFIRNSLVIYCSTFGKRSVYIPLLGILFKYLVFVCKNIGHLYEKDEISNNYLNSYKTWQIYITG